jgi:hypothetical protein
MRDSSSTVSLGLVTLLALAGCGDGTTPDATTGTRVTLSVTVAAVPKTFTTKLGWDVTLTRALLATGALYFFDGETLFARAPVPARRGPLELLWGIRPAYAHPGHYVPGNAKGEMLRGSSVDLLGPDTRLGDGTGVSGPFRSATFSFGSPVEGPVAAELGGHVIVLEGTAKKGAETRAFRAEVDAADVLNGKKRPQIDGCPFQTADVRSDGNVKVTIAVPAFFDQVELEILPKGETPTKLVDVTQSQLVRSIRGADRYRFVWTAK